MVRLPENKIPAAKFIIARKRMRIEGFTIGAKTACTMALWCYFAAIPSQYFSRIRRFQMLNDVK
ncbi:hypothetical protein TDB9533_03078 [Thalassocella blandensis]|nr:hypothetical protein TDB9533_03078 [Thalassocella blandensis]